MATLDKIKISGVTYDIIDATAVHSMDGYWTSGQTTDAITAATAALAETVGQELSGKVDNDTYTAYTAATEAVLSGKADTTDIPSVTPYADAAEYDSTSQSIKFYHGGTGGTEVYSVDATDFIKDGFLSAVTLENRTVSGESVPCLVFEWNTDAGIQETVIPVSGIFDPTNYYTKSETDDAIEAAVSGKADTTAVTAINDVLTGHTADTTIHVTSADKTEWSGKQDALVSGTNIKTVNGNSVLGSGDIVVQGLPTVSGTTLVFS